MNYYAFHIGDYASGTQHLTEFEDLAYRRLMDVYYVSERPLPLDRRQVFRLVRASSQEMREAVDVVILEFFTEENNGWHHKRCDEEIATAKQKSEKAKANGKLGGVAKARRTPDEILAKATIEPSEGLAPNPNPNPNPNPKIEDGLSAREVSHETIRQPTEDWDTLRDKLCEAAGWQAARSNGKLEIIGPIVALIEAGCDLEFDVLPIIRRDASRCRNPNWNYFLSAIAQARDDRLAAANLKFAPQPQGRNHARNTKTTVADYFNNLDRQYEQQLVALDEAEFGADVGSEIKRLENVASLPRLRQGHA